MLGIKNVCNLKEQLMGVPDRRIIWVIEELKNKVVKLLMIFIKKLMDEECFPGEWFNTKLTPFLVNRKI